MPKVSLRCIGGLGKNGLAVIMERTITKSVEKVPLSVLVVRNMVIITIRNIRGVRVMKSPLAASKNALLYLTRRFPCQQADPVFEGGAG